ncbi:L-iditol 2-dehydrogenase [Caldanaerobius fijiensis DSM 17918]|uniref:L-iditol 2-dehydrogenase n=1 Tax=Caldanaerobius fijiensis DSM 17918 TaxID=1121256 RepID=A0A1M5DB57_9THEO|nr:galactitol-1-phosphate 5-dehydrogenase [Caldanaerobius fijiensis]SHF64253.1 L-iditol 2-dehydrogenase [Caldanaerobius fijiensis DSM 17918]
MKAAVLHGKNDIRCEEIDKPFAGEGEVIIEVKVTGICGSDLPRVLGNGAHYYPIVLGHEFSGVVCEVGPGVTNVSLGDRIAGAPLVPCHRCTDCQEGHYSQCTNYTFIGSRIPGSWAEYVKIPAMNAVVLPEEVSFEEGAFFEPSTVALHGLFVSDFRPGFDSAVLGCGTIGQLTIQWLRILGANHIYAFDIDNEKLSLAQRFGADVCINTANGDYAEIKKVIGNACIMYVFETAGVPYTQKLSLEIAANKATVCYIGTPVKDITLEPALFEKILRKELALKGSWMSYSAPFPGREWTLTGDAFKKGLLKIEPMIYRRFPLESISEAFELYQTPLSVKGKVLLISR